MCKVYEIEGDDPSRTASAVRCHRDSAHITTVDGRTFPICEHHGSGFRLWIEDDWLYAIRTATEAS